MFTYSIQADTIRVQARDFGKDPAEAIKQEIHRRYANKVVPEVGLCISLLDIVECSEGAVLYGDGCFYYKCQFRLIILRPYIGEAFVGKVKSQSEHGIVVTLGFFDDILIPPNLLPEYSVFDPNRRSYFWAVADDPPPPVRPTEQDLLALPTDQKLYVERRDWIRVRVEEEHWDDASPVGPGVKAGQAAPPPPGTGVEGGPAGKAVVSAVMGRPPYSLVCSMAEPGTGVLDWWDEEDVEEEGEGEMEH